MKKQILIFMLLIIVTVGCSSKQPTLSHAQVKQIRHEVSKEVEKKHVWPDSREEITNKVVAKIVEDAEFQEFLAEAEAKWSFKTEVYATIADDPDRIVQNGSGVQITLKREFWYVYASIDNQWRRFKGQSGKKIDIYSAGLGGEYVFDMKSKKNEFSVFADIGGYFPKYKKTRETSASSNKGWSSPDAEGQWREMNDLLAAGNRSIMFEEYSCDYKAAIGGKVGFSFIHYWTENISSGISLKYRYLNLEEKLVGYNDPITHGSWNYYSPRSFSGAQASIKLLNIKW